MPTKEYSNITESPNNLLELDIKVPKNCGGYNQSDFHVEKTPAREAIESIFSLNSFYTLLRTSANPLAIDEVRKNKKRLSEIRGIEKEFYFDASVMDTYLDALKVRLEQSIGKKNYASFPLVATRDVHNLDRPIESVQLPTVHVIRGDTRKDVLGKELSFRGYTNGLGINDSTYTLIKKQESPMNYNMGTVELLREKQISPLIIHKREWNVSSEELRNAADFLLSWTYVEKHNDGRFDDFPNADDL